MYIGETDPEAVSRFERASRLAGISGVVLGALALLGWALNVEALKDPVHLSAMKPNAATCFILVGVSLLFARRGAAPWQSAARVALATTAAAISGLTLLEYFSGVNIGIDEVLFADPTSYHRLPPGRMAFVTAVSFLLLGLGVDFVDVKIRDHHRPCDWLAMAALLPALIGAADYALDWSAELTGIAFHTVIGLLLLGTGLLASRPGEGWMRAISSPRSGGTAARRLLPFVFAVPLVAGALRWAGERSGIYGVEFGAALMIATIILVIVMVVWANAGALNRAEEQRLRERAFAGQKLQQSEERYRSLTVATSQIVWFTDPNGEVVRDMPMWREFTGMSSAEMQGWGWIDSLHPDDRARTAEVWQEALAERKLYETEYRLRRRDGEYRHVWVRGVPILESDGRVREWVGTCTDITERKRSEAELRRTNRALRTIHRCGEALIRAQSEDALLRDICRVIVEDGGYRMAWVGYAERNLRKQVRLVAHCGVAEDYAQKANITWDESDRGCGPTGVAIRTGTIQCCQDFLDDTRMLPWREAAAANGFRSSAVFPLREGAHTFGALSIYSAEPAAFHEQEIELLGKLADNLAYGVVSLRARLERERVEAELEWERQRFSDVLDRLPAYVVLLAPDYTVPFANKFFRERFGESGGRRCYEYLFHRDSPCEVCESFMVLRDGKPRQWDWVGPDKRDYEIHDYIFHDRKGTELILEMGIDVTERKRAEEKVQQSSLYARSLLEASLDPLVTIGRDGRIMDVNRAAELVTGYDRDHLVGSDFSGYFTEPERAREGYRQVFADGTVHDYPLSIRHLSGPVTDVLYNATVYRNAAGEVEGVFAAARDITERKRAEEALAQRTAELERSNRELQDFASIASHDLQEPLRKVMAFGDRLRDHAGASLDETGNDYLMRMQNAASRMSSLIEALLEYSRVTTKAQPFERVDLNRVAADVLSDLETRIQENKAHVEIDPLPAVMADRLQMRQLLQNLLANALKFHEPGVSPRVRVSAMKSNGSWSVVVEDHGVGFDRAYADRIFRPFQRLHGRAEFPGSGMGLAICRKIVDRHKGTISARGRPGEGAVFTFTLPADQQEPTNDDSLEAEYDFDRRGR